MHACMRVCVCALCVCMCVHTCVWLCMYIRVCMCMCVQGSWVLSTLPFFFSFFPLFLIHPWWPVTLSLSAAGPKVTESIFCKLPLCKQDPVSSLACRCMLISPGPTFHLLACSVSFIPGLWEGMCVYLSKESLSFSASRAHVTRDLPVPAWGADPGGGGGGGLRCSGLCQD